MEARIQEEKTLNTFKALQRNTKYHEEITKNTNWYNYFGKPTWQMPKKAKHSVLPPGNSTPKKTLSLHKNVILMFSAPLFK